MGVETLQNLLVLEHYSTFTDKKLVGPVKLLCTNILQWRPFIARFIIANIL